MPRGTFHQGGCLLLCQECPKRPFCSQPCPEAEAYANQDKTPRREFFHFSAPHYKKPCEPSPETPPLTKIEWKILTLAKKIFPERKSARFLGFPGRTSASDCSSCAPDLTVYPPFLTKGRYGQSFRLSWNEFQV